MNEELHPFCENTKILKYFTNLITFDFIKSQKCFKKLKAKPLGPCNLSFPQYQTKSLISHSENDAMRNLLSSTESFSNRSFLSLGRLYIVSWIFFERTPIFHFYYFILEGSLIHSPSTFNTCMWFLLMFLVTIMWKNLDFSSSSISHLNLNLCFRSSQWPNPSLKSCFSHVATGSLWRS